MPLHHLMIGTWTPPGAIFTVEFDDEALTLKLVHRTEIPHDEPVSWIAFDHKRENIYGAAMKKWSSFSVRKHSEIVHETSHPLGGDETLTSSAESNIRAIFLLAAKRPPYCVYANPFYRHAGFGNVFSVTESGALAESIQNYPYQPNTGIHGMVFDPTETYLYSADLPANKVWVHLKASSGKVSLVGSLDAPAPGDHPRWVAMHPSGQYLYVLMEAGNRLCEYVVDPATHMPVFTYHSFPLIPPGIRTHDPSTGRGLYRSDVCALSMSARYLFATARSNSFDLTGYMAAFRLSECGSIEEQLCLTPTPTSGGHSNAVSPCDWSDEWLAMTDDQEGWVDMYRWEKECLHRAARVRIGEPGFGMNAIWYD